MNSVVCTQDKRNIGGAVKLDRKVRDRYHVSAQENDALIDDAQEEQEQAIAKLCASGLCKNLQDKMLMKLKVVYVLNVLFSSNHNIHKSLFGLCFWALDSLIERFQ